MINFGCAKLSFYNVCLSLHRGAEKKSWVNGALRVYENDFFQFPPLIQTESREVDFFFNLGRKRDSGVCCTLFPIYLPRAEPSLMGPLSSSLWKNKLPSLVPSVIKKEDEAQKQDGFFSGKWVCSGYLMGCGNTVYGFPTGCFKPPSLMMTMLLLLLMNLWYMPGFSRDETLLLRWKWDINAYVTKEFLFLM